MIRPRLIAAASMIAALLVTGACTLFSPSADPLAPLVAGQTAAALAANIGTGLETTCVIKAGNTTAAISQGFSTIEAAFAAATADVQAGDMNAEQIAFNTAIGALSQVQSLIAAQKPAPAAHAAMLAQVQNGKKKFVFTIPVIISLVQAFLPAFEQGGAIYDVAKALYAQLTGATATAYTPADVASAQAALVAAIDRWTAGGATVCP